jgi:hypothetical protein
MMRKGDDLCAVAQFRQLETDGKVDYRLVGLTANLVFGGSTRTLRDYYFLNRIKIA